MRFPVAMLVGMALCAPAFAQTNPRDLLTQVSFSDRSTVDALRRVQAVIVATEDDASFDARVTRATAIGYRAKLTGSRSDLAASKKLWDALVAFNPRDPEGQLGLGAWHLATLERTGGLLGRVLGANRTAGNAALDRAVAAGGNRAFYAGLAALFRLRADPDDARARQLAEQAAKAPAPTALDRIVQRATQATLAPLRAGNHAQVRATARRLLPLGQLDDD